MKKNQTELKKTITQMKNKQELTADWIITQECD